MRPLCRPARRERRRRLCIGGYYTVRFVPRTYPRVYPSARSTVAGSRRLSIRLRETQVNLLLSGTVRRLPQRYHVKDEIKVVDEWTGSQLPTLRLELRERQEDGRHACASPMAIARHRFADSHVRRLKSNTCRILYVGLRKRNIFFYRGTLIFCSPSGCKCLSSTFDRALKDKE